MRASGPIGWAAAAMLTLLAACTSGVNLTSAWVNPSFQGKPFSRVLVVAEEPDGATRRIFEDSFAGALNAAGVQATPAYAVLPANPELPSPEALREAAARVGADGVLATRLLRVEQKTRTSPGYVRAVPVWGWRTGFYNYYGYWRTVYVQPPPVTYNVAELQTDLWSLQGGANDLAWSATSQALSPGDAARVGSGLAAEVAEDLRNTGLLAPATK